MPDSREAWDLRVVRSAADNKSIAEKSASPTRLTNGANIEGVRGCTVGTVGLPDQQGHVAESFSGRASQCGLVLTAPLLGFAGVIAAQALARSGRTMAAFWASSLAIVGVIGTAGAALFPFIMPSSIDPDSSLTVWDSVSSRLTLNIMLWATLIFMPLIIIYTSWAYRVMGGKVTAAYVRENSHSAY